MMNRMDELEGDLGSPNKDAPLTMKAFIFLASKIAPIFSFLGPSNYSYCFQIIGEEEEIKTAVARIEELYLPADVAFYEADGMKVFKLRTAEGPFAETRVCYLVHRSRA